ncbi:MAG: macro domain-containing protein [bacterium]
MTSGAFSRILVLKGDLLKIPATAVVNAANTELWLGAGVAGAIAATAGPTVEPEAMAQGPIEVGQAVLTRSGALASRGILYIIHAATMEPGQTASPEAIARATFASLELATARRMSSIAFPALGTGAGGVSLPQCAGAMLTTIASYLAHNELPRTVHIACWDDAALTAFKAIHSALATEGSRA